MQKEALDKIREHRDKIANSEDFHNKIVEDDKTLKELLDNILFVPFGSFARGTYYNLVDNRRTI